MNQDITQISQTLQSAYDEQYTDKMTAWRELGGKYKAKNILEVCRNHAFSKVLECGAGEGSILKFLDEANAFSELHAIEISDTGVDQIRKRNLQGLKNVQKFNGYELPYPDNAFDMVYCSHVIEHVEHPRILLREIKRVSAFQVFEVPLDYAPEVDSRMNHFLSYGHINIYTPSLFRFLLRSEGFDILQERQSHTDPELIRYIWYENQKKKKTWVRELILKALFLRHALKRITLGKKGYRENGFAAYTCLTQGSGDLHIF